ncbi:MAG TPA: ABC transporter substrate-binding protein [Burkholderiaceae bacterium]|nr:ABC transporter substrate-binding protein [Burkholderiaceae bacterium]
MKRLLFKPLVQAAVLAAGLAGSAHAQGLKAEVIHWWTSGGEAAAVKEFANAYNKAGGVWVDTAIAGAEPARSAAVNRIVGGNPSTAAQFNISKQFLDLVEEGMLNDMDEVAKKEGWDKLLPAPILNTVKVKGRYYAVPVNIHAIGWFWYSKAAFQKAGIAQEPRTVDELFAALDKLKAAGLVPLALGGQSWQEKITFDAILANVGGSELFLKVYRDRDMAALNSEAFKRVLATFKRLKNYVDPGSPGRNWNDATSMVISGKAGVQIMGDWAKGEFSAAGQSPGKEYGCFPGLGPKSPYIITGDVFVFPKTRDANAQRAQRLLAATMTSPATQVAFNNKKGSIPIRTDVDASSMDVCAKMGLEIMKDPSRHLPNAEMLVTPDVNGALQDVVTKFWNNNQSVDDAVKAFAAALKS